MICHKHQILSTLSKRNRTKSKDCQILTIKCWAMMSMPPMMLSQTFSKIWEGIYGFPIICKINKHTSVIELVMYLSRSCRFVVLVSKVPAIEICVVISVKIVDRLILIFNNLQLGNKVWSCWNFKKRVFRILIGI